MAFVIAVVCVIVLTLIATEILSRLHPACSSLDFPNNDAYFAHVERRDRFIYEEQVIAAGINAVITVGILAGLELISGLPGLVLIGATSIACLLLRAVRLPPVAALVFAMLVGIAVVLHLSIALTLGAVLGPVAIFAACWLLLYPL